MHSWVNVLIRASNRHDQGISSPRTLKNAQMSSFLGIVKSENMSNHSYAKNFETLLFKLQLAVFFALHLILGKKSGVCGRDDLFILLFT